MVNFNMDGILIWFFVFKSIALGLSCFLFFLKMLDKKPPIKKRLLGGSIFIVLFAVTNGALSLVITEPYKSLILLLLFSVILSLVFKRKYAYTLTVYMVSYAAALTLFMICSLIAVIAFILTPIAEEYPTAVLYFILFFVFYKLKVRMSIRENSKFHGVAVFFSKKKKVLTFSLSANVNTFWKHLHKLPIQYYTHE